MARTRLLWLFCVSIGLQSISTAQIDSSSTTTPTKDTQAITILQTALQASGGQTLGSVADCTARGSITYSWPGQDVTGSALVRLRGTEQFRLDAMLEAGTITVLTNRGEGLIRQPNGAVSQIPAYSIFGLADFTIPILRGLSLMADDRASVIYQGLVSAGGRQLLSIRWQRNVGPELDSDGQLSAATQQDVFIDPRTYQIIGVHDSVLSEDGSGTPYAHAVYFDDFRSVGGLVIPFQISEWLGGQRLWTLQLQDVQFNQSLSDSDFNLQ